MAEVDSSSGKEGGANLRQAEDDDPGLALARPPPHTRHPSKTTKHGVPLAIYGVCRWCTVCAH